MNINIRLWMGSQLRSDFAIPKKGQFYLLLFSVRQRKPNQTIIILQSSRNQILQKVTLRSKKPESSRRRTQPIH